MFWIWKKRKTKESAVWTESDQLVDLLLDDSVTTRMEHALWMKYQEGQLQDSRYVFEECLRMAVEKSNQITKLEKYMDESTICSKPLRNNIRMEIQMAARQLGDSYLHGWLVQRNWLTKDKYAGKNREVALYYYELGGSAGCVLCCREASRLHSDPRKRRLINKWKATRWMQKAHSLGDIGFGESWATKT
jgi:hypothetical protein